MLRSFHIPVIIGDTVFVTPVVVTLQLQEVVGTDVLQVQEVGICIKYMRMVLIIKVIFELYSSIHLHSFYDSFYSGRII